MCGFVVKPCAARGTGGGGGGGRGWQGGMNQLFKISRHVRSVNWGQGKGGRVKQLGDN